MSDDPGCLACAALALVQAVQDTLLKKDAILIDFPMERIGDVLVLVEPHFKGSGGTQPSAIARGRPRRASMSEFEQAIRIADRTLDRVGADPDDDQAILARQFLRLLDPACKLPRPDKASGEQA